MHFMHGMEDVHDWGFCSNSDPRHDPKDIALLDIQISISDLFGSWEAKVSLFNSIAVLSYGAMLIARYIHC